MAGRLSKIGYSEEYPHYYKSLSRRLYHIMDDIGVSTEMRKVWMDQSITAEILQSVLNSNWPKGSIYIIGSSFEGTTTLGLKSDVDLVLVLEDTPVVVGMPDVKDLDYCLLMIQDCHTPAGYVKLQGVVNGVPRVRIVNSLDLTSSDLENVDGENRYVFTIQHGLTSSTRFGVIHGPAIAIEAAENANVIDYTPALRCRRWPDTASTWLCRQRHFEWPGSDLTDTCKRIGCLFVHAGHPYSDEKHLQWRLSFSLQERILISQFNATQLKCYTLLKFIKKDIIRRFTATESLSSYHCKTVMFYMLENTPADIWRVDNLLTCLCNCLKLLLTWSETGVCPNYFISEENLFEGRIQEQNRIILCQLLKGILTSDVKCLLEIKSDQLGCRLGHSLSQGVEYVNGPARGIVKSTLLYNNINKVFVLIDAVLRKYEKKNVRAAISGLYTLKARLENIGKLNEHPTKATRKAIAIVLAYVDLSLISNLTVLAKNINKDNDFLLKLLLCQKWHEISMTADSFSSKLKQASFLYMLGYCDISLDVLLPLEHKVNDKLQSFCGCLETTENRLSPSVAQQVDTMEQLLNRFLIPCIVFLPSERELTPSAICYEMNKSVGSTHDNRFNSYDLAVVDGKICLYFLLYLNHCSLEMDANAACDADNIQFLIKSDQNLSHREAALNLLGWIYQEKGLVDKAMECFMESLSIKPEHNAACRCIPDIL